MAHALPSPESTLALEHAFAPSPKPGWGGRLLDAFLLVLAMANMLVVLFDFTYLEARPTYLRFAPGIVALYDPVKAIEPHRTTEGYIAAARRAMAGPTPEALGEMRSLSSLLLADDPFAGASMSGTFEQIKNRLRRHMQVSSAKVAFDRYWSPDNWAAERVPRERAFFERDLAPLFHRNYYRAIGENGRPYDAFWLIDLCFVPAFVLEFLWRGAQGIRRGQYASWKAVCAERWYDLAYFVPLATYPFSMGQSSAWHLIRIVSVGHRMRRMGLINPLAAFERPLARLLDVVTDLVNVKLLSNYQKSVAGFRLQSAASSLGPVQQAQLAAVADALGERVLPDVLEQILPQLEALVTASARQALERSPAFHALRRLPLVGMLPEQTLAALVGEVVHGTHAGLIAALRDQESRELAVELGGKFSSALLDAIAKTGLEAEAKRLAIDWLEVQKRRLLA